MYIIRHSEKKLVFLEDWEDVEGFTMQYNQKAIDEYGDYHDLEVGENISREEAAFGAGEKISIYRVESIVTAVEEDDRLNEEEKREILQCLNKGNVTSLIDDDKFQDALEDTIPSRL